MIADPIDNQTSASQSRNAWIEATMRGMSVDQKIAQLFVLSTRHDSFDEADEVLGIQPGGIHRFPTGNLKAAIETTRHILHHSAIPPLISGDIEGGMISYPFATGIPNQMGMAACDDLELSARVADIVARESAALGYNWSFTPVVDINRAFRNAVVGTRSYGSDVDRIIAQATTYVRQLQARGIAASAKHWPGDGIDDRDQHLVTSVNALPMAEWDASFGRIYRALIEAGLLTIMSAHIALPAYIRKHLPDAGRDAFVPGSVSSLINNELLRGELGFTGLIVSDASVMGGLTSWMGRAEAVPALIANGCDMILFSRDARRDMAFLQEGLRKGRLTEERLDDAVRRVLELKARLGLHEVDGRDRLGTERDVASRLSQPADADVARVAAGKSLTLVKDQAALLPLRTDTHKRIVVIAEEGWNWFSGARDRSFAPFFDAMSAQGFELRAFDPDAIPTPVDTDLVIYLVGQEATPGVSHIFLNFAKLHGSARNAMVQFNCELPTVVVSFGQPYYLYDCPNHATYINAYCALPDNQTELVQRLIGKVPFTGVSPVDAFCGMEQLRY
jgi:beta-N-acetylhexosaminidase